MGAGAVTVPLTVKVKGLAAESLVTREIFPLKVPAAAAFSVTVNVVAAGAKLVLLKEEAVNPAGTVMGVVNVRLLRSLHSASPLALPATALRVQSLAPLRSGPTYISWHRRKLFTNLTVERVGSRGVYKTNSGKNEPTSIDNLTPGMVLCLNTSDHTIRQDVLRRRRISPFDRRESE